MVTTEELYLTEYTNSSSEHSIYSHTNQAEKIVDILFLFLKRIQTFLRGSNILSLSWREES